MPVDWEVMPIEAATADELAAMSGVELGRSLNTVAVAALAIGRLARETRIAMTDAKNAHRKVAKLKNEDTEAAATKFELAKCDMDLLRDRARTLRDLKSTLQTLIRSAM